MSSCTAEPVRATVQVFHAFSMQTSVLCERKNLAALRLATPAHWLLRGVVAQILFLLVLLLPSFYRSAAGQLHS